MTLIRVEWSSVESTNGSLKKQGNRERNIERTAHQIAVNACVGSQSVLSDTSRAIISTKESSAVNSIISPKRCNETDSLITYVLLF